LQWADAATLDVLHYCARAWAENQLPILILLALRSDHLAADPNLTTWLTNLGRALPVTRLNLGPITAVDTAQLVEEWQKSEGRRAKSEERRVTHSSLLAPRLADWIYHETAGQPFFISETLKLLQEETDIPPHTIVPGVRQLILTRLNRLTAEAMALLTAIAIIGRPTHFEQLCQIIATDEDKMLPALDELLQHQLLLETANPRHPYTFSHDKIRDIVYTQAGDARRRLYHRRALAALQQEQAPPGELAHHALSAHLYESAFRHSLAAGDAALALFAITDAIYHYEQARAVSSEQVEGSSKQLLYTNLSRAYELAGNFDKAKIVAEEMLTLAQAANEIEMICAALNRLATLAIYTNHLETAATYLQQILETAESTHHTYWLAEAEWGLGQLAQHRYDMQTAKAHSLRAWQLAQEVGVPELIARSLNTLAYAHLLLGDFTATITHMSEARERYTTLGNRALTADCQTGIAGGLIFQGHAQEGIEAAQQALHLYQEIENPWGILFSTGWLVAGLLDAGRFAEALASCLQTAGHADTLGPTPVTIWHRLWIGNAYRALFQLDKAIAAHQQAASLNRPHPLRPFAEYIAAELCADYLLAGDWQLAGEQAQETLKQRNYQALPQIVLPRWATTAALLQAGHHQQARDDLQQSQLLWGQLPRFRVAQLRSQAVLAEWEGDTPQAINYLEEAHNLANEIGLPDEEWQILAKLAELYPDATQPQAAKSQAVEIVNRLAEKIGNEKLREGFVTAVATLFDH
jgi:tetratricopeptide (TPR) repeat protein